MTKCNTLWQNTSDYEGLIITKRFVTFRVACIRPLGHEGRHFARVRNNVDNAVAEMEW